MKSPEGVLRGPGQPEGYPLWTGLALVLEITAAAAVVVVRSQLSLVQQVG
jgi:hypothetical protein